MRMRMPCAALPCAALACAALACRLRPCHAHPRAGPRPTPTRSHLPVGIGIEETKVCMGLFALLRPNIWPMLASVPSDSQTLPILHLATNSHPPGRLVLDRPGSGSGARVGSGWCLPERTQSERKNAEDKDEDEDEDDSDD